MRHSARILVLVMGGMLLLLGLVGPALAAGFVGDGPVLLAQDDGEEEPGPGRLFGTLRGDEGPVGGVELQVTEPDGTEVGIVVSEEDGSWEVEVPAGDYVVNVVTLPEGVELRDEEQETIEVSVDAGDRQAVPIRLGDAPETRGAWATLAQQLVNGLRFGLIISMTAIGLSLVFGTTGLINFAHGDIVIFGAFAAWSLNAIGPGWPLLVAAPIGVVLSAVLGGAIDRGMFRPLRRRGLGLFQLLVVTIGLSLVIRYGILMFYGGSRRQYTDFIGQDVLRFGPISQTPRNLIIMALAIAVLVLVGLGLQYSRMGKAMRAVADNRDLAESSGIDVEKIVGRVWIYGSGLAGLGGILFGSMFSFQYINGFQLLLLMFAAVILGGLGTAFGAMFGGIVIGVIVQTSSLFSASDLGFAWALGLMVLVLLVRPQGLFGRRERVG